ncbi:hypothetical protein N7462_004121 [Penicillium macrosclerotiorum]|uniref:uncharacterized protein n=1 Tax=Penicillium macrosclerotiorum TaxID=303699 RepID=UPI0025484D77|nr:uncharacterized protein N7462_004121 [Penicillium macrosclerotiorum]KAJ5689729.1 hypothetical protein N7462_004121 [Penicillium macrosclerotiorum]
MSNLIVVVGLTGKQGGSVANVFLNENGWRVRGITRDASKATDWQAKGVEVVEANLDDKASLVKAFEGAYAIFGTTDFWGPVFNPATRLKLAEGQQINEYAFHYEQQQAINIAEAAAETAGLQRFISSALCNAKHWTQGRLPHVYHFDSKALAVEHIKANLPDLAAKMSVVQIGSYMTNWGTGIIPRKQPDGTWRLAMVGKGDTPIPQLLAGQDTGFLVRALLQVAPGKNLLGTCKMLTWKEYLKVWCETQQVPYGGYDELSIEQFVKFMPVEPVIALEFAEMFALADNPGYDGGDPSIVLPEDLGVPCPTTSWETWCRQTDFSHIVKQK